MLDKMTTFVRIADAGSISRAARSLGLSVGMASRHLQALEEDLGAQLMRRTTRRIDLTQAGEEFLVRARALLSDLAGAKQVVRTSRVVAGKVVLSVPACLGVGKVAPLIPGLLDMHPRLHIDLRFEERGINLLADGIDIAVRIDVELHSSPFLIARKVATYERVLCAAPAFLQRHGSIGSVAALAGVPCILEGNPRQTIWCFETSSGRESVIVQGRMRTDNTLAARDALVGGAGVGWLPHWLAHQYFSDRRLERLLPDAKVAPVTVFALTHKQMPGGRGAVEYESRLNEFFPGKKCYAVCQYDRRRFDADMLLDILHTHPKVLFGREGFDNSSMYFVPNESFSASDRQGAVLDTRLKNLSRRGAYVA